MRIQFNKVYIHSDPTEMIQNKLSLYNNTQNKSK